MPDHDTTSQPGTTDGADEPTGRWWAEVLARPRRTGFKAAGFPVWVDAFLVKLPCPMSRARLRQWVADGHPPPATTAAAAALAWAVDGHGHAGGVAALPPATDVLPSPTPPDPAGPEPIVLINDQCPGDVVAMTAAVRDLVRLHGGTFQVHVATLHPSLWEHNPHVASFGGLRHAGDKWVPEQPTPDGARWVRCDNREALRQSADRGHHMISGYGEALSAKLGVPVRSGAFRGDLHLSEEERSERPVAGFDVGRYYWVMAASSFEADLSARACNPDTLQAVVDHFASRGVAFVQVGDRDDYTSRLSGVVDLVGLTTLRDLVRLVYHSEGVLASVGAAMHVAAATPPKPGGPANKPCVVLAGGREPTWWAAYPSQTHLSSIGTMPCCQAGGCGRDKAYVPPGDAGGSVCQHPVEVPGRSFQGGTLRVAKCIDDFGPERVIAAVERYYRGGVARYPDPGRTRRPPPGIERVEPDGRSTFVEVSRPVPPPPAGVPFDPGARLYPARRPARIGVVVGTHGAAPYVHLQLESARRCTGSPAVLIQDDCSPVRDALAALCRRYGASFGCNTRKFGHHNGDLVAFFHGLLWARARGVDVLVKFSRRFQPTADWVPGLLRLAAESQAHTFTSYCTSYEFGFRSECVAMHVPSWFASGAVERFRAAATGPSVFVEAFVDQLSQSVRPCAAFARYAARRRLMHDHTNYAMWRDLMGDDRHVRPPGALWHNACPPAEYLALARSWGITGYALSDFEGLHSHGGI